MGDDFEILWMNFKNGGSASITSLEKNFKNILTVALSAKMSARALIVRFHDSNASRNGEHRRDIRGVWLL